MGSGPWQILSFSMEHCALSYALSFRDACFIENNKIKIKFKCSECIFCRNVFIFVYVFMKKSKLMQCHRRTYLISTHIWLLTACQISTNAKKGNFF